MGSLILKDNKPLYKTPQSLVHIQHNISILQYKYWWLMLKSFTECPVSDDMLYISMSDLSNYLGYTPNKSELRDCLEALRIQPIIFNFLNKDGQKEIRGSGFISEWSVTSRRIGFILPKHIKEALIGNENIKQMFLLMSWEDFHSFTGKYEAIIFKLCLDYSGVGSTPYFETQALRNYLGLTDKEYTSTSDFFRFCVDKPIEKINKNKIININVKAECTFKGRSKTGVKFLVEYRKKESFIGNNQTNFANIANSVFINSRHQFSTDEQYHILETYTLDDIDDIIASANAYIDKLARLDKKVNVKKIYQKAFKEKWQLKQKNDLFNYGDTASDDPFDQLNDLEKSIVKNIADNYINKQIDAGKVISEIYRNNIYKKAARERWGLDDYYRQKAEDERVVRVRQEEIEREKQEELERQRLLEQGRMEKQQFIAYFESMNIDEQNKIFDKVENELASIRNHIYLEMLKRAREQNTAHKNSMLIPMFKKAMNY